MGFSRDQVNLVQRRLSTRLNLAEEISTVVLPNEDSLKYIRIKDLKLAVIVFGAEIRCDFTEATERGRIVLKFKKLAPHRHCLVVTCCDQGQKIYNPEFDKGYGLKDLIADNRLFSIAGEGDFNSEQIRLLSSALNR